MIKIFGLADRDVELALYHAGGLAVARHGEWGVDNFVQLTPESARDLAHALTEWADSEEALYPSTDSL